MIDFIAQLVVQLTGELVPRRAGTVLVGVVAIACGLAFLALAGFGALEMLARRGERTSRS